MASLGSNTLSMACWLALILTVPEGVSQRRLWAHCGRSWHNKHEAIHVDEIIDAAKHDDNLSIELIEEVGEKAGKAVAFLINTFNPETVIVGGELAEAGDYLMLPLKSATNKYSLNLVYKDTKFRLSKMGKTASAWGAAMLIRNQVLGLC